MVDEFENDLPNNDSVGERVRASVAELCGALDDLIDDNDATSPSQNQNHNPSLREQLIDSWQGKSYYERLEGMVNAGAGGADFKGQKKLTGMSTKTKPLSSINLNSVNNGANNQPQAKKSSYVVLDWHCSSPQPNSPTSPARTRTHRTKSASSISLLQPLYKNQNYMIPQKALQLDKTAGATRTTTTATTRNALAELTKLAVPTRKDELSALKSDLLKIIDVCQRKLAVCDDKLR
jgi:hypothetical protein